MEISSPDYHQIMNTHNLEDVLLQQQQQQQQQQEKKPRPNQETALKCPRCESTNTKFCYYNNYSLSQPRYFCKGCRRYWTKGGSLRNVPVGGGCRKNKKSSSSSSSNSSSSSLKRSQDHHHHPLNTLSVPPPPPFSPFDPNDLTLAFARLHNPNPNPNPNPSPSFITTPYTNTALLDALRNGATTTANPTGFQSLYYDNCLGLDGGLLGSSSVPTTTATITTTTSHEPMDHHGDENKAFLGLQWQLGNLDAGRDYWNGVNSSSSWHDAGLINSSLI